MLPKRLKFIMDGEVTLANLLERAIAGRENEIFYSTDEALPQYGMRDEGMTGAEFAGVINRLCHILQANDLRRFARLAIWKSNSLDYFFWSFAAMRRGAISVPINGGMPTSNFLKYIRHCGAETLVTDMAGAAKLAQLDARESGLRLVIITDGRMSIEGVTTIALADVFAQAATEYTPPHMDLDQDVMICHTSGTTGFPKGVLHGSSSFIVAAKGQMKMQFITRRNKAMMAGWMNHHISQAGCITSLAAGVRTHALINHAEDHVLRSIETEKPQLFFAFPDVFQRMCAFGLDRHDLSSIRVWMSSGDSMHEVHIRQLVAQGGFLRLFGKTAVSSLFMEFLGSSEIGFAALIKISERRTKTYGRMVGKPAFTSPAVRIGDAEGRSLPANTVGRMLVKGPTLFKGYWNQHDRGHDVIRDGWWWTGDVGFKDTLGRFYHIDRDVDTIVTANGPVYGLPVEEEALKLPGVIEAALVSRKGSHGDEAVVLLQMAPGHSENATALLQQLKQNCGWADHVSAVVVTENSADMPRGLTGKVLKRTIRDRFCAQKPSDAAPDRALANV